MKKLRLLRNTCQSTAKFWLFTFSVAGFAILFYSPATSAIAQETKSVNDGVFTKEQATRGEIAYEQECATCHLADLLGDGIAPALTGAAFDFRWSELSVGDMFVAIRVAHVA